MRINTPEVKSQRLLNLIGREAITIIQERVAKAQGSDGPMRPYTGSYAQARARAGLGALVNLSVTGSLMLDLTIIRVNRKSVSIGWSGTSSVDMALTASGPRSTGRSTSHNEIVQRLHDGGREFLKLNRADRKMLAARVKAQKAAWYN